MKYIENNFYPAWIPEEIRGVVDLSELAEPNQQILETADILMETLGVNIAVYKYKQISQHGTNGICSLFKSATLKNEQLDSLHEAERRLKNCVIVAYNNPVQYHTEKFMSME